MKRTTGRLATGILLGLLACQPALSQERPSYAVPQFRHIDPEARPPDTKAFGKLTLLTDQDFPPFSFLNASGELSGISVELLRSACVEMRLACEFKALPHQDLPGALDRGEGDAIISGLRVTPEMFTRIDTTAPYFRAIARFAAKSSFPAGPPDAKIMQDKRVGSVKGSGHAAWIKRYFPLAQQVEFENLGDALESLRTGKIELVFGDGLQLVYWIAGEASRGCCKLVEGAFVDEQYFSNALSIIVRRNNSALRATLDYGLDRMQRSGAFATIFKTYVPLSPW